MARSRAASCAVLILAFAVLARAQFGSFNDKKLGFSEPQGTLRGAYSYVLCETDVIVEPETTDDVIAAIRTYSMQAAAANQTLKVRLTQRLFHSSAAFTCPAQSISIVPEGTDNPANILSVSIVQNKLNKVLAVDRSKYQMRVQPGMQLWTLAEAATAAGMSITVGSIPVFGGLTLGGTIAAGAHGSGDGSAHDVPMDMVKEVVWVDAAGKRHVATSASPEWKALYAGLGLVGVMTELVLQLGPVTHTHFKTIFKASDKNMVADLDRILKTVSPSVLLVWRPDLQEYTINMLNEVNASTPLTDPELVTTMLADLRYEVPIGSLSRDNQADIKDSAFPAMNNVLNFFVERMTVNRGWAGKPYGGIATPPEGVGLTNRLQTTMPCAPHCTYAGIQFKSTAYDTEFTIDFSNLQEWVDDVKAIVQKDLWRGGEASARYLGPGYIWLRVGSERPEYLATQYGMKRPVFLQSTWLRSREIFQLPMRYGYVQDLIELLGLAKYNMSARPHWGKNTDRTFTDPRYPIRPRYPEFSKILDLQAQLDPKKVFEPPLFTKVAEQQPYTYYPGCAMDFECFCTEDVHCNLPGYGSDFKCVPSIAFPEFKVCKGPADWDPQLLQRYGKGAFVKRTHLNRVLAPIEAAMEPLMHNVLTAPIMKLQGKILPIGPIGK